MAKQEKSNVYLVSGKEYKTNEKLAAAVNYILEYHRWPFLRNFWSRQLVGIKPSFAEKCDGRKTLFSLISSIGKALKKKKISAFICDTSNRHKKISSNALEQIRESYLDCQDFEQDLPVFMLDGINGSYEHCLKIKGEDIYLGGELPHLDGLVMISVLCKHPLCGITGAIYNLGAGLASKRGKIKQRTTSKPQVNVNKCYSCKRCLHACPVHAIVMGDNHVVIDEDRCVDCGRCVEIARRCGISYNWNATPEHFIESITKYASAAGKILSSKGIYVNIVTGKDESIECVLISKDPLAVDLASLDICNDKKVFPKSNKDLMNKYIKLAKKFKIGKNDYKIQEIAY